MNLVADGSIQYIIPSAFPVGIFFFFEKNITYLLLLLLLFHPFDPNPTLLQPTPEKFLRPELH